MNNRMVYMILETVRDENGYIPCIAIEGESGYYKTDWNWGKDLEQAKKFADERNAKLGINPKEAWQIVMGTM